MSIYDNEVKILKRLYSEYEEETNNLLNLNFARGGYLIRENLADMQEIKERIAEIVEIDGDLEELFEKWAILADKIEKRLAYIESFEHKFM